MTIIVVFNFIIRETKWNRNKRTNNKKTQTILLPVCYPMVSLLSPAWNYHYLSFFCVNYFFSISFNVFVTHTHNLCLIFRCFFLSFDQINNYICWWLLLLIPVRLLIFYIYFILSSFSLNIFLFFFLFLVCAYVVFICICFYLLNVSVSVYISF